MHANERARAFAIQVQVADVKLSACALKFRFIRAVNRARQSILRVIRYLLSVVVILSFDNCEHRTEDLFLFDRCAGFDVGDDSRLDKVSLLAV